MDIGNLRHMLLSSQVKKISDHCPISRHILCTGKTSRLRSLHWAVTGHFHGEKHPKSISTRPWPLNFSSGQVNLPLVWFGHADFHLGKLNISLLVQRGKLGWILKVYTECSIYIELLRKILLWQLTIKERFYSVLNNYLWSHFQVFILINKWQYNFIPIGFKTLVYFGGFENDTYLNMRLVGMTDMFTLGIFSRDEGEAPRFFLRCNYVKSQKSRWLFFTIQCCVRKLWQFERHL